MSWRPFEQLVQHALLLTHREAGQIKAMGWARGLTIHQQVRVGCVLWSLLLANKACDTATYITILNHHIVQPIVQVSGRGT